MRACVCACGVIDNFFMLGIYASGSYGVCVCVFSMLKSTGELCHSVHIVRHCMILCESALLRKVVVP